MTTTEATKTMPSKLPTKAVQGTKGWRAELGALQKYGYTTEEMDLMLYGPSLTMADISRAVEMREKAVEVYVKRGYMVRELELDETGTFREVVGRKLYVDADDHKGARDAYEAATGRTLVADKTHSYSTRPVCAACKRDRVYSKASHHLRCFVPDASQRYDAIKTGPPKFVAVDS